MKYKNERQLIITGDNPRLLEMLSKSEGVSVVDIGDSKHLVRYAPDHKQSQSPPLTAEEKREIEYSYLPEHLKKKNS